MDYVGKQTVCQIYLLNKNNYNVKIYERAMLLYIFHESVKRNCVLTVTQTYGDFFYLKPAYSWIYELKRRGRVCFIFIYEH